MIIILVIEIAHLVHFGTKLQMIVYLIQVLLLAIIISIMIIKQNNAKRNKSRLHKLIPTNVSGSIGEQ